MPERKYTSVVAQLTVQCGGYGMSFQISGESAADVMAVADEIMTEITARGLRSARELLNAKSETGEK